METQMKTWAWRVESRAEGGEEECEEWTGLGL